MNDQLVYKSEKGTPVTTSLLVAEKFCKNHRDVLKAIDELVRGVAEKSADLFFETNYIHPQNNQAYRMYVMNRDGFTLLAMGFTGVRALQFKLDYINAFNRMEEIIKIGYQVPTTFREALLLAAEQQEVLEKQRAQLEAQRPAVIFTNAVTSTDTNILTRDLAKLLAQNGVAIGEERLYDWMVTNGYLIRRKRWSNSKQSYKYDYMPTQRGADLKVFFVTQQTITIGANSFITHTVKITPKGQVYFVNKFLKQLELR